MKDLKSKKILIVDDEIDYVETIADEFLEIGFQALKALNGAEAYEIFLKEPDIDLVISDIRMPHMDGRQLLKKLKESNRFLPIVMLISAQTDLPDHEAYHLGADSIFSKPFKMSALVNNAKKLLIPLEERLSVPDETVEASIHSIVEARPINLGRGGISFCTPNNNLMNGKVINFKINYAGEEKFELTGQGIVRWSRRDIKSNSTCTGIEFTYIPNETRDKVLKEISNISTSAFIPYECPDKPKLTE